MGRIVVTEFVSLDGVMEAPGGEDFKYKGWSFDFDRGEEGNNFKLDETRASEALLLGRRTYEGFAGAWPSREGEFADMFNSMPKYVVSSTLESPTWNNTTVLNGDVVQEVEKLKEEIDGDIVVHGSNQLVHTLVENDLVDELRLMVFPVVLGTGKRIFGETSDKKPLRLVDSKTVGDGVAILIYRAAGGSERLGPPVDDEAAVLLGHLCPERGAGSAEALANPRGVLAGGEPRVAVLELQRDRLDAGRPRRVERDEEEQAEIVPSLRVDGVVVDEVAEVVQDPGLHALEHMRRVTGDERRAGHAQSGGRPPDVGQRLRVHVRAPMRGDEHGVGLRSGYRVRQPLHTSSEIHIGDPRPSRAGGIVGGMVATADHGEP